MIAFDLCCSNGHVFEGWFEDSNSFEIQMQKGLVSCPFCDDSKIKKILSPVAFKKNQMDGSLKQQQMSLEENLRIIEQAGRELKEFIDKNFENVGTEFTKEALKMHYGLTEHRNIRGVSSESDEELLKKEGITFFKLPLATETDSDPDA